MLNLYDRMLSRHRDRRAKRQAIRHVQAFDDRMLCDIALDRNNIERKIMGAPVGPVR